MRKPRPRPNPRTQAKSKTKSLKRSVVPAVYGKSPVNDFRENELKKCEFNDGKNGKSWGT